MDPGIVALFIPIVAIVGGIASGIVKMWVNHEQEMARINATRQVQSGEYASSELEQLRLEVAQLRDTTTRYDLSVEKALEELRYRVGSVENNQGASPKPQYSPTQSPEEQKVTLGS